MKNILWLAMTALSLLAACGDDTSEDATGGDGGEGGSESTPAELAQQQIDAGAAIYGNKCAHCHGGSGEGTSIAPAVVGDGVFPKDAPDGSVRDVQFVTALDVFLWASEAMPGDAPGTMAAEDMLKVFAFDLSANGVTLERPLDAELADSIVLNP